MPADATRPGASRWFPLLVALVAALAAIPALDAAFVYDDHRFYQANDHLAHASVLWRAFADPAVQTANDTHAGLWRPLRTLLFALERAVFGEGTLGPHAVSVLLHAAGAAAVTRLLATWRVSGTAALIGGLLYALHPLQVECVAWVSSQGDLLAAGLLWAALLALHGERPWLSGALGVAALLAKEQAAVWPLLAGLSLLLAGRPVRGATRAALPAAALTAAYLIVRSLVLDDALQQGGLGHGPAGARRLASMVAHQVWFSLVPVGSLFDWQMPLPHVDGSTPLVAAFVALGTAGALVWSRTRVASLWWCTAVAPTLFVQVLIPLNILVAERFLLLALPAVALGLARGWDHVRGARPVCVLMLAALAAVQFGGWNAWQSERTLWQRTLDRVPDHARANHWIALARLQEGNADLAVENLIVAARSDGGANTFYHLGFAWEARGAQQEQGSDDARACYDKARGAYLAAIERFDDPRAQEASSFRAIAEVRYINLTLLVGRVDEAVELTAAMIARPLPTISDLRYAAWRTQVESLVRRLETHVDGNLWRDLRHWAESP